MTMSYSASMPAPAFSAAQGMLFTSLPRQPRRDRTTLEEELLPPRERALLLRYPGLSSTFGK